MNDRISNSEKHTGVAAVVGWPSPSPCPLRPPGGEPLAADRCKSDPPSLPADGDSRLSVPTGLKWPAAAAVVGSIACAGDPGSDTDAVVAVVAGAGADPRIRHSLIAKAHAT